MRSKYQEVIHPIALPIELLIEQITSFLRLADHNLAIHAVILAVSISVDNPHASSGFQRCTQIPEQSNRVLDFVAGTLVVHDRTSKESDLFFNTTEKKPEVALYQAAGLGIPEVELIETFLARRLDIPPEVRRQSAVRIADMVGTKLGIEPNARPANHEDFLELVVKEFRSRAQYR